MINNVQTEKIEQLDKLIWNQEKDKAIGRNQCSCLYSGLPNEEYHLATSLRRNCKQKKADLINSRKITLKYAVNGLK